MKAEGRARGGVKWGVVAAYFRSFCDDAPGANCGPGGCFAGYARWRVPLIITGFMLCFALSESAQMGTNVWLAHWQDTAEKEDALGKDVDHHYFIGVYGALTGAALVVYFSVQYLFAIGGLQASTTLHSGLIGALMTAPMSFHDTTPVGRTLNRCSKDVDFADTQLRESMSTMMRIFLEVMAVISLVTVVTKGWLAPALVPVLGCYWVMLQFYRHSSRELKRLDSVSNSPIFSHFSETLQGLSSIRAFGVEEQFRRTNERQLDVNHRAYFMSNAVNRWLSLRLEVIGASLILTTTCLLVRVRDKDSAGLVGLALVYITQLLNTLNWGVRQAAETEVNLNAVERLLEYQGDGFAKEADASKPTDPPPDGDAAWPSAGRIEFQGVELRYRPGLPLALRGVDVAIPGGTKVGVCGRTGSGKSSMLVALFRLVEPCGGRVVIDGVDAAGMGLDAVRGRLAIIPQTPTLFYGTVRSNLDPFERFGDDALWAALRHCHMHDRVAERAGQLDAAVAEGGENFSVGERQLLCLGRALLRRSKVIVLDEATASVDFETDALIQKTIRQEFSDCTIVAIAHRIHTIIDMDRVLVLEDGKVAEFGSPKELCDADGGLFSALLEELGPDMCDKMRRIARGEVVSPVTDAGARTAAADGGAND